MKTKLYYKFVEAARKHAFKSKIKRNWIFHPSASEAEFVCRPAKMLDDGSIVRDDNSMYVVGPHNLLSFVWAGLLWREVWRKKYRKYSRKYWEADAILKRVIETGKEED